MSDRTVIPLEPGRLEESRAGDVPEVHGRAARNPGSVPPWQDEERPWTGSAWTVYLECEGRVMTVPFWQGAALKSPPTVADVLECLLTDASYVENGEEDELVADMPYSKARPIVEALHEQVGQLRVLLGDAFDAYVFPGSES